MKLRSRIHMKLYILLALCMTSLATLEAQHKTYRTGESKIDLSQIEFSLSDYRKAPVQYKAATQSINYANWSNHAYITDDRFQTIAISDYGVPYWFTGELSELDGLDLDAQVYVWLDAAATQMQLQSSSSFRIKNEWTDDLGYHHIKLDQLHHGVKVFDGEIMLHAKDGQIYMQNGNYAPSTRLPDLTRSAKVSSVEAQEIIRTDVGSSFLTDWNSLAALGIAEDAKQWQGELVYYNNKGQYTLAHNYVVFANLAERYEYIVDAETGDVLDSWSTICQLCASKRDTDSHAGCSHSEAKAAPHTMAPPPDGPAVGTGRDLLNVTRNVNTYELNNAFYMIDASRPMYNAAQSDMPEDPVGAIWTIDIGNQSPQNGNATYDQIASNNNNWNNSPEGVSAHYNAGESYAYFRETHNRNGITGDGQTIVSIVNVTDQNGNSMGNAFYNSLAIWYGNGDNTFFPLGRALDVAGHELTHGVVENTANLIYQNESGAMNESFADIFGAMIDRDDWRIGEDVARPGAFPGGALRNISNPHNGANTRDYGNGWQPEHMNERFTGSEDNGGVHINSGIPNYAYYKFATAVGKETAERVFYRALSTYLTRSSGFNDLRYAVEQSARDLYNANVVAEAGQAFSEVGIGQATVPDHETDIEVNAGEDLLLSTNIASSTLADRTRLYVDNLNTGQIIFNPLSSTSFLSRPSVTDDGSQAVFVGEDNTVHLINMDWSTNPPTSEEFTLTDLGTNWFNVVISRDGNRLALLENAEVSRVVIYDDLTGEFKTFELFNPSFSEGVQTGEVLFADAMEFDHSGNVLMYDALNQLSGANGQSIAYWDIGFLEVWNPSANTFADGNIEKLFGSLPENISIGNPTFSKNSPFIISFDSRTSENNGSFSYQVIGMNVETNTRQALVNNDFWGFPSYSRDDTRMAVDVGNDAGDAAEGLATIGLQEDKISLTPGSINIYNEGEIHWGVWFSNGTRFLPTSTEDISTDATPFSLSPVPASEYIEIDINYEGNYEGMTTQALVVLTDITGKTLYQEELNVNLLDHHRINTKTLEAGAYVLQLTFDDKTISKKFIKE